MTDQNKNLPATTGHKTMQIKNLCPGLQEMGKIKIGKKGEVRQSQGGKSWQAPQKIDHFLITTMERGTDNNFVLDAELHQMHGEAPKAIPVRLLYDDPALNFATRYILYNGKTVQCTGDGESAVWLAQNGTKKKTACPCHRQAPDFAGDDGKGKGKCKINGILSAMIEGAEVVGGVWKFRTTSYNSVVGILSSLALIRRITGGRLAGIPLEMTVTPKTVQDPIRGSQQTIYVVGLRYKGTVESLQNVGYKIAMDEAKHGIRIEHIEEDALRLLAYDGPMGDEPDTDVVAEFYPEEAAPVLVAAENEGSQVEAAPSGSGAVDLVAASDEDSEDEMQAQAEDSASTEEAQTEPQPREYGKPSPGSGRKRRNTEEMKEDQLADEAKANADHEMVKQDAPGTGSQSAEASQPATPPAVADDGACDDLF